MSKRKTIFLDIDGTILTHPGPVSPLLVKREPEVLPGVHAKLSEWLAQDYCVIITTARREPLRDFTEKQLRDAKIDYDYLLMGIGSGERVVINDNKPGMECTCRAITINRNEGLENVDV